LAAVALGVYFFLLTRDALHGALSPDDLTNIHRAFTDPVSQLVRSNLLFFQTLSFRPLGSAWYRVIFHFAGINPLPYHAVNLVILAANMFLTYAVARRLTASPETGWLTALLACYHRQFNGLYFDTGFIFDVLCYFFYFATFLVYLRARADGRPLGAGALAACCALYICALNSKEMAVTLPLFLAVYEGKKGIRRIFSDGRGVLALGAITLLFVIGRAAGAESLLQNPAYRPAFTWDRLMLTNRSFLGDLFLMINRFTPTRVVLLWSALAAIAWLSRSKALRFAFAFLMLSAAPMAFLEPRAAAQYYIPLLGWALYAAVLLVELSRRLPQPVRAALPAAVMILLYSHYKAMGHNNVQSVTEDGALLRSLSAQMLALHPALPELSRLLFRNETNSEAWDTLLPTVRLTYRDDSIQVDRARRMDHKIYAAELGAYDQVLDYRDGRLVDANRPPDPHLHPQVLEVLHADFSNVTAQHPAQRGEILILKTAALGATDPDIADGQPFPTEPLAQVRYRVGVRLNGALTRTLNSFGWPGAVNTYRVDIRMPEAIQAGTARLELWAREMVASPVQFPVR
jgi:hypothetical protein